VGLNEYFKKQLVALNFGFALGLFFLDLTLFVILFWSIDW